MGPEIILVFVINIFWGDSFILWYFWIKCNFCCYYSCKVFNL